MSKTFFEVFPALALQEDMQKLLSGIEVTKVSANRQKTAVRRRKSARLPRHRPATKSIRECRPLGLHYSDTLEKVYLRVAVGFGLSRRCASYRYEVRVMSYEVSSSGWRGRLSTFALVTLTNDIPIVSLPVGMEFLVERYKFFEERVSLGVRAGRVFKR